MSRTFLILMVCGVVVTVSGLGGIVAGVMAGSWQMAVTGALSAVGGLLMWVFGVVGRKQSGPAT